MKYLLMRKLSMLTIALTLGLTQASEANKEPTNTKLIPIQEYNLPFGEASVQASLQAAEAFLASFDERTKAKLIFDLDAKERAEWSNLPAMFTPRAGVSVGELSDGQRKLLFDFLASSLSEEGYRRVSGVMAAEAYLSDVWWARLISWSPKKYWISFYGTPSAKSPWGWQFGGHHLGLNLSIEGNRVKSMSPSFVGTEPAIFTYDGLSYEVVVDMHLAGYALYGALEDAQKSAASAGEIPKSLYTGAGKDGVTPPEIGISAADMTMKQKSLLLATINQWVSIQPPENSKRRMEEIEKNLDRTIFAWTGTNEVNSPTYMIIQAPTLIIELLSTDRIVRTGRGHYHTVYRNPTLEYGGLGP